MPVEVRITTLSENTAARMGILAEWGLSVLVEVDNLKILLDAGQGISTVRNATALGIDLSAIDKIVLSHGHADHTGGLRELLATRGKPVGIVAHPDIWAAKYVQRPGEEDYSFIGIPFDREELEGLGASFTLTKEPLWIADHIVILGEVPMLTGYEQIDPNLYVKGESGFSPDLVMDDRALAIRTDLGLVVVAGCAHRGIINTLENAQKLTGVEIIHTLVGGTHLIRAEEEQIELTIAELKEMGIQRLGVSHCTGFHASVRLAEEFGDIFFLNNAGTRLTLPRPT
jgi:7,8-dihydropterin-6-yl-methyl-4-(beta-D-ribofuranosyl)aminobenzene 5'-phosphate synthase